MPEMKIVPYRYDPPADPAREYADYELDILENEIQAIYEQAYNEVKEKADKYLEWYKEADENMKAKLDAGLITAKEYKDWRTSHMLTGKRWYELADSLATDLTNYDKIAASIVSGHMPEVYAVGYNYALYQIEKQSMIETSFTLYNRQAVERLIRDKPNLLPLPKVNTATDYTWNMNHVRSATMQGILQGQSIPEIAKNIAGTTTGMNRRAAIRTARTAMTSAENGGRMQSIKDGESIGIKSKRIWYATLDGRTRYSHRQVDREIVEGTTKPFSNGCMFPGDPNGKPEEVYNCRCRMDNLVTEVDLTVTAPHNGKLGTMSYDEWKNAKGDEEFFKAARREKYDKDQYYKYRKLKVNNMPKNYKDFQHIKYSDPDTWENMKKEARAKRNEIRKKENAKKKAEKDANHSA